MKNIQEKIRRFFENKVKVEKSTPLLLACSGGADSTALFHLLLEREQNFEVLHVNYQLRGQESEREMLHVKALCEEHNVKLHLFLVEKPENENTQLWARNFRYAKIKAWLAENTKGYAATAHHQKDQAETVLLNLVRGTGPKGMRGIPPERERILRPLLACTREEILNYLTENQYIWREDSSNASRNYQRNMLRHDILPQLEKLNPQAETHLAEAAVWGNEMQAFIAQQVQSFLEENVKLRANDTYFLSDEALSRFRSPLLLSYFWLSPRGFSLLQIREWAGNWKIFSYGKQITSPQNWTLQRTREGWELFKPKESEREEESKFISTQESSFTFRGQSYTANTSDELPQSLKQKNALFLDAEKLKFPLCLRPWKAGERFAPLGMGGKHQLVADFLMHRKLEPSAKRQALVLVDAENAVLAIPFFSVSEKCKVSSRTEKVFFLKHLP